MNPNSLRSVFAKLATTRGGVHCSQLSDMLTTAAVCDQLNALPPAVIASANYAQAVRPAILHALDMLSERAQRIEATGELDGVYDLAFRRLQRWASNVAGEFAKGRKQRV